MRQKQTENDDQIKLKPIMGIRPGVYLTALYSFILAIILFFLFVFPGLRNPGAMLIVKTEPAGAAIRVNDVYMGLSGTRIFVPKGTHTITAVMPGFESQSAVHRIPSRVFGSNFFPIVYRTEFSLKTADPAATFALYAADFAAWTFAGEPTGSWQIPLNLSEGAYRVGPYAGEAMEELQEILKAATRFTTTQASFRDLIRAKILLDNNGYAPNPTSLLGSISDILAFLSENPGSAQWLFDLLPNETAGIIGASSWYKNMPAQDITITSGSDARQLTIAGLNFISFSQNNFFISENPVPRSLFLTFLDENPEWKEHYTDYVPEEIAVNRMTTHRGDVISGITWYAAEAFCKWLTGQLPQALTGMEVRLPSENEWRIASESISNMLNPGWEWCADPYTPLSFITASNQAINAIGSPERSLRGRPFTASTETRASLPPDLSSPFVTFRLVLE